MSVDSYGQCTPVIGTNPDPAAVCEGVTIQFSDNSACTSLGRRWNFGDGSANTNVQNPSHTFNAGKIGDTTYTVTLEKQDINGVWTSSNKTINIYKKPAASFNVSSLTACVIVDTLQFTNTSPMPAGNTVSWNFGDGSPTSNVEHPTHTYNSTASSVYSVGLTVTNQRGCSRTVAKDITVNEIPNPNFTMDGNVGCDPLMVTFTNTTAEGAFPVTGWNWDFGGLGSSLSKEPGSFTFNGANVYAVSLSATNTAGCTNTTTNNVVVKKTPTIAFSLPNEVCKGDSILVSYSGDANPNATYNWNFQDAQIISGSGPGPWTLAFTSAGTKDISLSITENNCFAQGQTHIKVNPLPQVSLSSNVGSNGICLGEEVLLSAIPANYPGYTFYNDGAVLQSGSSPTLSITGLSMPNNLWVVAQDNKGCGSDASNSLSITVNQKPSISISTDVSTVCEEDTVTINATGNFDHYTFVSGFSELQSSPSNVLKTTSLENGDLVSAYATDKGCEGLPSNAILINVEEPVNPPVINCASSTNNTVTVIWNDNPLVSEYQLSVDHGFYYQPLTRSTEIVTGLLPNDTVWFKIFGKTNLTCGYTEVSDSIYCIARPCLSISFDATQEEVVCEGDTVMLELANLLTPSDAYAITWGNNEFGKDTIFQLLPERDTSIVVSIKDSLQLGCPSFDYRFHVEVNEAPESELLSESLNLCEGLVHTFSASKAGYDQYEYYLNGNLVQDSSFHKLSTQGLIVGTNKLVLKTIENSCYTYDSLEVSLIAKRSADLSASPDEVCSGDPVRFSAAPSFDYYTFINTISGDTLQDSTLSDLSISNVYQVRMYATDAFGCISHPDSIEVVEKPLPNASISSSESTEICENSELSLTASSDIGTHYSFYRDYHLLQTGSSNSYAASQLIGGRNYYAIAYADGCAGPSSDTIVFEVFDTLRPPQIHCGKTGLGSIEIEWDEVDRATGYQVSINGSPFTVPSSGAGGLLHFVSGLSENDSVKTRVIALGPEPCGNSIISAEATCYVSCKNPFNYEQNFIEGDFCAGDKVNLRVSNISGGSGNYRVSWNGNEGTQNLEVIPTGDSAVVVSVKDLDQESCPEVKKTFWMSVYPYPEVSLVGDTLYCSDDVASFTATPNTYGNYQFFKGAHSISDGFAPQVRDSALEIGSSYYVIADDFGCRDTSNLISLDVKPAVNAPDLFCGNSNSSTVTFEWHPVYGATGYEISINGFPFKVPSSGSTGLEHTISGLEPGQKVRAKVRAIGQNPCLVSKASDIVSCYALDCSKMSFTLHPDTTVCQGSEVVVRIKDIVSPGNNYGFAWNGGAYSTQSSESYVFNSSRSISVSMIDSSQLNCPPTKLSFNVAVTPLPAMVLNSNVNANEVCENDSLILTANSASATQFLFYRDYHLLPAVLGNRYIVYPVKDAASYFAVPQVNGCLGNASDTFSYSVSDTLIPPTVNCGATGAGTINVVWDSIPGAVAYRVSINGQAFQFPSTGATGLSHLVSGLNENDSISAEIVAVGPQPCGNSGVSKLKTCYISCEHPFSFKQNFSESSFCFGDKVGLSIFDLEGGSGDFTIRWNGTQGSSSLNFQAQKDTLISVSVTDNQQASCPPVEKLFRITVNPYPVVQISVDDRQRYCSNEELILRAQPGSYENYQFFDRVLQLSNGPEPYTQQSNVDPENEFYVIATEKGCSTKSNILSLDIVPEVRTPNLFCGDATSSSIVFQWHKVSGAVGYEVSINGSGFRTPSSGSSGLFHEITGLNPGTALTAQVRAIAAQPCSESPVSETVTCYAQDCAQMSFNINRDTTICSGAAVEIQIKNIQSPSNRYALSWDSLNYARVSEQRFFPKSDTTISVSIIDSSQANCPTNTLHTDIKVNPLPDVQLSSSINESHVCENQEVTLTATSNLATSFIFFRDYYALPVGLTATYQPKPVLEGRNYFVVPTARGCIGLPSDTFVFTVEDTLVPPQLNCGKTALGSIELVWDSVQNATGFEISVNAGAFEIPSSGATGLSHLVTGLNESDSVKAWLAALGDAPCGNSINSDTIVCYVACEKPFDFTQNFIEATYCEGEQVDLEIFAIIGGSKDFIIHWNGIEGGYTNSFTAEKDTLVEVSVTDLEQASCRPVIKKFWITVNPIPRVDLIGNDRYCSNEAALFEASPRSYENYTFYRRVLSISDGANPTMVDSNLENEHFYYVVSEDFGCVDTSNVIEIFVAPALGKPNLYCGTTSTSSIDFEWLPVPGAVGYEISINGLPFATPSGGVMGLIHQITGLAAGTEVSAVVRALGADPCMHSEPSDTATCIAQDCGKMVFNIPLDTTLCEGENLTIALSKIQSPSDRFGFSWNDGSPTKDSIRTLFLQHDTTLTVSMADSTQLNCPGPRFSMKIKVTPLPEFVLEISNRNDSVCFGEDLIAEATVKGFDRYIFTADAAVVQDSILFEFLNSEFGVGQHSLSAQAYHKGCTYQADEVSFEVVAFPELTFSSSETDNIICEGDSVTFTANAGFHQYEFVQGINSVKKGAESTYTASNLITGQRVYVIASTYGLCYRKSELIITEVNPIPNFELESSALNNEICDGDTVSFNIHPKPDNYKLYRGSVLTGTNQVAPSFNIYNMEDGDSIYIHGNIGTCTSYSDTIVTAVAPRPNASISLDRDSICIGSIILAYASGGEKYLWSTGSEGDSISLQPNQSQQLWVQAILGNCASKADSIEIFVDDIIPVAGVGPDEEICRYESIPLFATGGDNYLWTTGDSISNVRSSTPMVTPLKTDTFTVVVSNAVCSDSANVIVYVDRCLDELPNEPPQIITPNNDGKNDFLHFEDIDYFKNTKLTVYNRWSVKVFETERYNNDWRGTGMNGSDLPAGTYYYVLELGNGREAYTNYLMIQR